MYQKEELFKPKKYKGFAKDLKGQLDNHEKYLATVDRPSLENSSVQDIDYL
jgi:hypothetical protein